MAQHIQWRRGTAAEATSANPVLAEGEAGFETDTGLFKVGDGTTAWTSLDYAGGGGDIAVPGGLDATGTPSSSTFLRGDGTWATPAGGGGGDLLAANNLSDLTNAATARTNLGLAAVYQPLDSDLTSIAALTTTSYGRAFLALADAAAGRTALSLGTAATTAASAYEVAGAAATAQAAAIAASQPLDSDLTAIAALSTTSYGRSLLAAADASALRTLAGVVIGTDVPAMNPAPVVVSGTSDTLAAVDNGATNRYTNAGLVTVTIPTDASVDLVDGFWCVLFAEGAAGLTLSTSGITLVGSSPTTTISQNSSMVVVKTATADTWMVIAGTSGGGSYQPLDADLTAIAALTSAADKGLQSTGAGTWALYDLTAAGKALLDAANAAAQRTTLGLGTAAVAATGDFATAAQGTTADGAVPKSLYDANTVLAATSDNTPAALTVAASRIVGRKASGDIAAMTGAETGALIKIDELAAPTDVTTLNASTSAHGLLKKLSNTATEFMNGAGNWAVPAGGGGVSFPFGNSNGGSDFRGLPGWVPVGTYTALGAAFNQYDPHTFAIFVPSAITVTGYDIVVSSGHTASTVLRAAIYAGSGTTDAWAVGALNTDMGTVATTSTGVKSVTGLSIAVAAGWHVVAFGTDAPALILSGYQMVLCHAMAADLSAGGNALRGHIRWWYDYGASPNYPVDGFPTPLTGNSQYASNVSGDVARMPITLRWTNP